MNNSAQKRGGGESCSSATVKPAESIQQLEVIGPDVDLSSGAAQASCHGDTKIDGGNAKNCPSGMGFPALDIRYKVAKTSDAQQVVKALHSAQGEILNCWQHFLDFF